MGDPHYRENGAIGSDLPPLTVPRLELSVFGPGGELVSPEEFRLDVSRRELNVRLSELVLDEGLAPGVNLDRPGPIDESQRQRTTLNDLSASFDVRTRRLRGSFRAQIPDSYPGMSTTAQVRLESTPLEPWNWRSCEDVGVTGQVEVGPAEMDFRVRLSCDANAFRRHIASGIRDDEDPWEVLRRLPGLGIDAAGAMEFLLVRDIPLLKHLLRSRFQMRLDPSIGRVRAHAPGFDLGPLRLEVANYRVHGIVPVPAGGLFDVPVVGLGLTTADYSERSSRSLTLSATPSIETAPFAANLYLYFDVNQVWRVSDGVDFGIRFTVAPEAQQLGRIGRVLTGRAAPRPDSYEDFVNQQQERRRQLMVDPTASPTAGEGVDSRPFVSLKAQLTW